MIKVMPIDVRMSLAGRDGWMQGFVETIGNVRGALNNPDFSRARKESFLRYVERSDVTLFDVYGAQLYGYKAYLAYYLVDGNRVVFEIVPEGESNLTSVFVTAGQPNVPIDPPVNYWVIVDYDPEALESGAEAIILRASGEHGVLGLGMIWPVDHIWNLIKNAQSG